MLVFAWENKVRLNLVSSRTYEVKCVQLRSQLDVCDPSHVWIKILLETKVSLKSMK